MEGTLEIYDGQHVTAQLCSRARGQDREAPKPLKCILWLPNISC